MKEYYVIKDNDNKHFCEESAHKAIEMMSYTDKAGATHQGKPHWTMEQVQAATANMSFPEGTTEWDKYVAFNSFYADMSRVLDEPNILKGAYTFYFQDEDGPKNKIWRYIKAMRK